MLLKFCLALHRELLTNETEAGEQWEVEQEQLEEFLP